MHFPIAFLLLSFGMDIIHQFSGYLPKSIASNLPVAADMSRGSYFLLSAGLITAVPAVITGIREAVVLIAKQGLYESDAWGNSIVRTKCKAMIAHATVNDTVLAITTYIWYSKRKNSAESLAGKVGIASNLATGAAAYEPQFWMVATEIPLLIFLLVGANIGGSLTYNFGIGFSAGGGSSKKKQ